jgi:hypothetical protein
MCYLAPRWSIIASQSRRMVGGDTEMTVDFGEPVITERHSP